MHALGARGLDFTTDRKLLPGKPDIVFESKKVAVFCDGDFWHGRDLESRLEKLARGSNAQYWTKKITSNVERDKLRTAELEQIGWKVLRFWESEIKRSPGKIADQIGEALEGQLDC